MFGSVGGPELILLAVVALLLFGPRQLPKIGRTVGSALAEFRRATTDFKSNLEREVRLSEVETAGREITDSVDQVKAVARGEIPSTSGSDVDDSEKS